MRAFRKLYSIRVVYILQSRKKDSKSTIGLAVTFCITYTFIFETLGFTEVYCVHYEFISIQLVRKVCSAAFVTS